MRTVCPYFFNTYVILQAVIVRPLSSVNALVRFAEEPQMFAIEFNDGSPVYVSLPQINYIAYIKVCFFKSLKS